MAKFPIVPERERNLFAVALWAKVLNPVASFIAMVIFGATVPRSATCQIRPDLNPTPLGRSDVVESDVLLLPNTAQFCSVRADPMVI